MIIIIVTIMMIIFAACCCFRYTVLLYWILLYLDRLHFAAIKLQTKLQKYWPFPSKYTTIKPTKKGKEDDQTLADFRSAYRLQAKCQLVRATLVEQIKVFLFGHIINKLSLYEEFWPRSCVQISLRFVCTHDPRQDSLNKIKIIMITFLLGLFTVKLLYYLVVSEAMDTNLQPVQRHFYDWIFLKFSKYMN